MTNSGSKRRIDTRLIVCLGMFCAIAYAVMYVSKLIPINVAGFLNFDFKDVVIVICGYLFGPVAGMIVSVLVSFIEMITVSGTGPVGFLMNVISTWAFMCPAALLYKSNHKFNGAVWGLVLGTVSATIVMMLWNWLITPLYMGVPREAVVEMLLPVFMPFNLLKYGINSAAAMMLYKPIVTALRHAGLVKTSTSGSGPKKKLSIGVTLVSLLVLVSLVLVVLAWTGII